MFIFCAVQDDLDFEFDPVSKPSDQERADLAKCGTDNIVTAYNAGLISQRTALREMKQQGEMGGFPGMGGEEDGDGGPDLPHAGRGGEVGDKPPTTRGSRKAATGAKGGARQLPFLPYRQR